MVTFNLDTAPMYQRLVGAAGGNIYNLSSEPVDSGRGTVPQLPKVFDVDTTLGVVTIQLMSITSLFQQGGFGVGFGIFGTITAGANSLTIRSFSSEGDSDTICGLTNVVLTGALTTFYIHVAGRHNWLLLTCVPS